MRKWGGGMGRWVFRTVLKSGSSSSTDKISGKVT